MGYMMNAEQESLYLAARRAESTAKHASYRVTNPSFDCPPSRDERERLAKLAADAEIEAWRVADAALFGPNAKEPLEPKPEG